MLAGSHLFTFPTGANAFLSSPSPSTLALSSHVTKKGINRGQDRRLSVVLDSTESVGTVIPLIHFSQVALPLSLALVVVYLSFKVDQDEDYVRELISSYSDVLNKVDLEAPTEVKVGSVPKETEPIVQVVLEQKEEKEELVEVVATEIEPVAAAMESTIATDSRQNRRKWTYPLRLLQFLYFPWFEMLLLQGKKRKILKVIQALWLPWLPLFLPRKKNTPENQVS